MHWKDVVEALLRCRQEATIANLVRARQVGPEHGRVMAGVYGRAADELRRDGRGEDARFLDGIAGLYAANAVLNEEVRRVDEENRGLPTAA